MPAARTRRAVRLNPRRAAGCSNHGIMKTTLPLPSPLPSLFLSHGAPTLALSPAPAAAFLRRLPDLLPARPRAIVVASAHWERFSPHLSAMARNDTIHDFRGFPPAILTSGTRDLFLSNTVRTHRIEHLREQRHDVEAHQ